MMARVQTDMLVFGCALMLVLGAAPSFGEDEADAAAAIRAAIEDPERLENDRRRDAARRPADVLAFAGIAPGMKVADLMTGGGWYAELIARTVGHEGRVYAQNSAFVARKPHGAQLGERLAGNRLPQVVALVEELDALPGLPKDDLDAVTLVLFYHDTYWMKLDRPAMNRAIFEALKPGGVFLVVDHSALAGAGEGEAERLHRIEEAMVVGEVLSAGFALDGTSDVLRNAEDDRQTNVFKPGMRGKTDRFVLRFRKPVGPV